MEYKNISLQELQELFRLIRGSKIISLTTITQPRLRKGGPDGLVKITRLDGIINCDYANSVNNQRLRENKEPDFVPEPRSWGTRLTGLPMVSHVTKDGSHRLYLEVKVQKIYSVEYRQYGKTLSYEQVQAFLYEKKSNAEHQGVTREVIWRDYDVKNIIAVEIDGLGYIIEQAQP